MNTTDPDTRQTLIDRIRDSTDLDAWEEFVGIYRPVILKLAMYKGLQQSDAEEVAQQVLLALTKCIERWEPNSDKARFRTWLKQIVRNTTINAITRRPKDLATGGTTGLTYLQNQEESSLNESQFDLEWSRRVFRWAADKVHSEFQADTWTAFWLTAVDGDSPANVAAQLNKSVGAIYVARSRVMQRIQEIVRQLDGDCEVTE